MKLNLERPIVFFDLETTGLQIGHDHIIEIAIIKINTDNSRENLIQRIRPVQKNSSGEEITMHIPEETTCIHHITDEDVANEPTFKEVAQKIADFIGDADLAGFNSNKFDIPLLVEEFLECGVKFDIEKHRLVDVQNIFHKMEPRNLIGAYKFYCNKELEKAHSAFADIEATYEVFLAQIERYKDSEYKDSDGNITKPIINDISALSKFSTIRKTADLVGHIGLDKNGLEIFNFGKHKGKPVREVFKIEPSYYSWMMNAEFPRSTKEVITKIYNELSAQKKQEKLEQLQNKFNNKIN